MTTLLVGCPIRGREWLLPTWFAHIEAACAEVEIQPEYVFVISVRDHGAERMLRLLCADANRVIHVVLVDEDGDRTDQRVWNETRYHHMVFLRNHLLQAVRKVAPDLFLSLDSDILVAKGALPNLLDSVPEFHAVGGKLYMETGGLASPSYAHLVNTQGLSRPDFDGLMRVDVIMAMKLMGPAAYNVDYRYHFQGEDIGWSMACTEKGLKLGWDGRICSKHVMNSDMFTTVDWRCGY